MTDKPTAKAATSPCYLDELLREPEAAKFLSVTVRCLQGWRLRGGGPRFVRVSSRCIRYRRRDLIAWAEERLRESTSDDGSRYEAPAAA